MKYLLSVFTAPLSLLWGLVVFVRNQLFDYGLLKSQSFGVPLICVGNIAVGGTGKTPHVEYLLHLLHEQGYRVAMLSRGYGRRTRGYLLANPQHTAADIGDEPFQISRNCPFAQVAVAEKRVIGIRQLMALPNPPQVIVLDDAFQHRYVRAGLNILLTDAHRLYTTDHLLPWGRLREPASSARRAQVVVVTKCVGSERPALPVEEGQHLFYSHIQYAAPQPFDAHSTVLTSNNAPDAAPEPCSYAGRSVLLIAGIANPLPLVNYISDSGAQNVTTLSFADHHAFTVKDALRINQAWQKLLDGMLPDARPALAVTTQKDATRLQTLIPHLAPTLRRALCVQPITVEISENAQYSPTFNQIIIHYVSQNSRNSRVD